MGKRKLAKLQLVTRIYPKILKYRWFKKPAPILVTFGINNRCNLRCDYCFVSLEKRSQNDLPTEKLLDYIDQFIDLGAEQIDLQGGEPTLHPDLELFISHIVHRGVPCSITTNGFRVDRYLNALKKCCVVCVSIDGLPETTDAHRGKGAYEAATRALETMANHGVNIRMHGVLTESTTVSDLNHLVGLAEKFKTNINFVYALASGGNKTGCADEVGFPQHIRKLASHLSALKKGGAPVTSKEGAIRQVLNWPFGPQEILMEDTMTKEQKGKIAGLKIPRCLWGHLACFFNPDEGGTLYLCPRGFDRKGFFVKIGNRTVREAFTELAAAKRCYMCGQMGDLSYSFDFNLDNLRTWLKF